MNISTRAKALVGAVAIGGAAIAMGGAFTAGGISGTAHETPAFVGGSVDQTVEGATLNTIAYDVDEANNKISTVTLTFNDNKSEGKVPTIAFDSGTATDCTAVATMSSTCTLTDQTVQISTVTITVPSA